MLILGLQFKYTMTLFAVSLPFKEWFGLTVVNSLFSYYLPLRGGLLVRGAYLKYRYQFAVSHYLSLLVTSQIWMIGIAAGWGLCSALWLFDSSPLMPFLAALFLVLLLISGLTQPLMQSLLPVLTRYLLAKNNTTQSFADKLQRFLETFTQGLKIWHQHPFSRTYFLLIVSTFILCSALRLYSCFLFLGATVEFSQVLLIQSILSVTFVFSITPANLGIKEAMIVFSAQFLGVDSELALVAGLLDRVMPMLVIFISGLYYSQTLLHHCQNNK